MDYFARRLAGHSVARIARALNEGGVPCPSAADPGRNPHRTVAGWTLGTIATILSNPRYTGRQVWNRQRTDRDLADPTDVSLGHKSVQRWNLPDGWSAPANPPTPLWSAKGTSSPLAERRELPLARSAAPGAFLAGYASAEAMAQLRQLGVGRQNPHMRRVWSER